MNTSPSYRLNNQQKQDTLCDPDPAYVATHYMHTELGGATFGPGMQLEIKFDKCVKSFK